MEGFIHQEIPHTIYSVKSQDPGSAFFALLDHLLEHKVNHSLFKREVINEEQISVVGEKEKEAALH